MSRQLRDVKEGIIISNFEISKKINMSKFGFSFSLSRLLGIAQAKQRFARSTGIPTTKGGIQRKIGASILKLFFK